MLKRFCATAIVAATLVPAIAGCDLINSINPFAPEEEIPFDTTTAPADPNAPVDPNVAVDPNAAAPPPVTSEAPFRDAVNTAMAAAEAVQVAQTPEQWQAVAQQWQQAIALMQAVPPEDPNHAVAQQKVIEYQGYLQYAQQNAGG